MPARVHKEVIEGHMTVTKVTRVKGEPYEVQVDVGIFTEQLKTVTRRRPGYDCVEVKIYASEKEEPDLPNEDLFGHWEMPIFYRYDLAGAARQATIQEIGNRRMRGES